MTKIIIAEDNSQDRYLLETILKKYDYDVRSAKNGQEALDLAKEELPDILISDIMMPVMDGFSLCRAWKTDERFKTIPIVFYSATYISTKDKEFAKLLGATEFIIKPQPPDVLAGKLRNIIEQHRAAKPFAPEQSLKDEMDFFRHYNEVILAKLEQKITQLQTEITERKMVGKELLNSKDQIEELVKDRTALQRLISLKNVLR